MTDFGTGLVVGKFCPLHRGHQRILDQAGAQCRRLVIVSYTKPEFAGMGPEQRERWLEALYPDAVRLVVDDERLAEHCRRRDIEARPIPDNGAPDEAHRSFTAWLLRAILSIDVDAVFTSEDYGDGFADYLGQAQSNHGGPPVVHVPVDPPRSYVPVSGAMVRPDLHLYRNSIDPIVYRDFVQRVALLGGESTGKSTMAELLAGNLRTVHAAEYGRELWEKRGGALVEADMLEIARVQVAREESLAGTANRFLICDTTPLTTMLYSQAMFGSVSPELKRLAGRPYDLILLCAPDTPFVQDGTRRGENFRQWQHEWYVHELEGRGIDYVLLKGSRQQRVSEVGDALCKLGRPLPD